MLVSGRVLVHGRNQANSPVEGKVVYFHSWRGFHTSKQWLFGISEPSTVCIHILKHLQLKVVFFCGKAKNKTATTFCKWFQLFISWAPELAGYLHFWSEQSIELALCTTSNISCSPPGQPILAFTVDLIASSGLGSAGIYTACQKQHFHERVKHHISCSSITFHDLFKTYDIYNYNQHKDSKTWLIQHAPPHPFLHHECLTKKSDSTHEKAMPDATPTICWRRWWRRSSRPTWDQGIYINQRFGRKNNTCRLVVLFEKTQKTRYIEHLVLKLRMDWDSHPWKCFLSMLGVKVQPQRLTLQVLRWFSRSEPELKSQYEWIRSW